MRQAAPPVVLASMADGPRHGAPSKEPYIPAALCAEAGCQTGDFTADPAADAKFAAFVHDFRATALAAGIKPAEPMTAPWRGSRRIPASSRPICNSSNS